jgi:hypothetical protein
MFKILFKNLKNKLIKSYLRYNVKNGLQVKHKTQGFYS